MTERSETINQSMKTGWTLLLLLAGVAMPFVLVTTIPYYHQGDLIGFKAWADCLQTFGPRTYTECLSYRPLSPLNYPAVGLWLSGGVIQGMRLLSESVFMRTLDASTTDALFRLYLALFAALDFLLLVWLARLMLFQRPVSVAFLVMVLPSMVVGGILWGQLDGLSLTTALLAFIALWQTWQASTHHRVRAAGLWLLWAAFSLTVFALLKPLNTMALPFFFFFLTAATVVLFRDLSGRGLAITLGVLLVAATLFRFIDSRFELPAEARDSTLWHSWQVSTHGEVISGNGFNMWILLGRDMWSSSLEPFTTVRLGAWHQEVTPYHTGLVFYALLIVFLFTTAWLAIRPALRRGAMAQLNDKGRAFLLALLSLLLGLTQLGFNVLLTGTHERYLFLGYPFLLFSTLWFSNQRYISQDLAIFAFVAAILNGIFVFGAMHPLPGTLFVIYSNAFQASMHLILLIALLGVWLRIARCISQMRLIEPVSGVSEIVT